MKNLAAHISLNCEAKFTMLEWEHARNNFSEDVKDFDDEDHMDQEGEFSRQVNEACLHGSSKSFVLAQDDHDSHNPMLVHFTPQEMTWNEARQYVPWQQKQARSQRRKEKQKANKRESCQEQEEQDQSRGQSSSAASSSTWKPRYR